MPACIHCNAALHQGKIIFQNGPKVDFLILLFHRTQALCVPSKVCLSLARGGRGEGGALQLFVREPLPLRRRGGKEEGKRGRCKRANQKQKRGTTDNSLRIERKKNLSPLFLLHNSEGGRTIDFPFLQCVIGGVHGGSGGGSLGNLQASPI